jgi:hypothetical protein
MNASISWGQRIEEMLADLKSLAKLCIDSDDTEAAEVALKGFHDLCNCRNTLDKWCVNEWDFTRAEVKQDTPEGDRLCRESPQMPGTDARERADSGASEPGAIEEFNQYTEAMSLMTPPGSRVVYMDINGTEFDREYCRGHGLKRECAYIVSHLEIGRFRSYVSILGKSGAFNTACFANVRNLWKCPNCEEINTACDTTCGRCEAR